MSFYLSILSTAFLLLCTFWVVIRCNKTRQQKSDEKHPEVEKKTLDFSTFKYLNPCTGLHAGVTTEKWIKEAKSLKKSKTFL